MENKNGFVSHHAVFVGIMTNIMSGITVINKKKSISIGIFNIIENVIQKQHGVIKKNHHMKKNGFHHGIYKETIT